MLCFLIISFYRKIYLQEWHSLCLTLLYRYVSMATLLILSYLFTPVYLHDGVVCEYIFHVLGFLPLESINVPQCKSDKISGDTESTT